MLAMIRVNLLRRWERTVLACLGVAVGVTTVVALLAVTSGLARSAGDLARLGRADFGVFQGGLADLTASSLPASVVARVDRVAGVADVSPVQIVANAVAADRSILVFGSQSSSFLTRRLVIVSGHMPQGAEALVGSAAADRLHVSAGGQLTILGRSFRVAGIYRSGISLEDAGVELPLATTQALSDRPGEETMLAISIAPGFRESEVEQAVEHTMPGTVALGDPSEVSRVDTNSRTISKAAIIIAALALVLGAVVVINTMAMAVVERRREFGVLSAIGWTRAQIARLILGETMAVSLAGAIVGLGLGALAGELVVGALAAGSFVSPDVTLSVLARGLIVGIALGVLGALSCMWQVMRVPLLRTLQRS